MQITAAPLAVIEREGSRCCSWARLLRSAMAPQDGNGRDFRDGAEHIGPSNTVKPPDRERILIVKLGALGNIILSFQAFAAIRAFHDKAHITVLTSQAFADWMRQFPWFDDVLVDPRPAWWDLSALRRLGQTLAQ